MLLLGRFKISGHSMEPFIKNGESIMASGLLYLFKDPKIKDIVVFKDKNNKILIKRITKIKNGEYFLEGDNKSDSLDSKQMGLIKRNQIMAKFIIKI